MLPYTPLLQLASSFAFDTILKIRHSKHCTNKKKSEKIQTLPNITTENGRLRLGKMVIRCHSLLFSSDLMLSSCCQSLLSRICKFYILHGVTVYYILNHRGFTVLQSSQCLGSKSCNIAVNDKLTVF
jgi:hypothetical protein